MSRVFKGRFMFSFYVDLDLGILFKMLTAQIGVQPDLGI